MSIQRKQQEWELVDGMDVKEETDQECFEPSGIVAPASDFAFASWAVVMPTTSFQFAPARLAPLTLALCVSLAYRLAPLRLVKTRVTKVRLA